VSFFSFCPILHRATALQRSQPPHPQFHIRKSSEQNRPNEDGREGPGKPRIIRIKKRNLDTHLQQFASKAPQLGGRERRRRWTRRARLGHGLENGERYFGLRSFSLPLPLFLSLSPPSVFSVLKFSVSHWQHHPAHTGLESGSRVQDPELSMPARSPSAGIHEEGPGVPAGAAVPTCQCAGRCSARNGWLCSRA
jgi:hypothetical protein